MLENEALLIRRIRDEVPGFKYVSNPSIVAGDVQIGPLLPFCLVVPGESDLALPKEQDWRASSPTIEAQRWEIITLLRYQDSDQTDGMTEQIASVFMRQIFKAVHGFLTKREAKNNGFIYMGRDAPVYQNGWCEFPMTFLARCELSQYDYERPEFFQSYVDSLKHDVGRLRPEDCDATI